VKLSIGMIVGFSIFVGCKKQDEIIPEDSIADTEDFAPEGKMMILGKQLQNAHEKSRKLEHVRDYLRDNYPNSTEEHLDDLFDFYIDIQ
jgi:hypothetical protein